MLQGLGFREALDRVLWRFVGFWGGFVGFVSGFGRLCSITLQGAFLLVFRRIMIS